MNLIGSEAFRLIVEGDPLVYVDAGARGGLEGPWAEIHDERLRVVAFEPDAAACVQLRQSGPLKREIVPKALWSQGGLVEVHMARERSTSSVHPPNWRVLERHPAEHGEPRTTLERRAVECVTLDSELNALGRRADFIKIDTQGAEFEILNGASGALADSVFGVIAESWVVEVHEGQRLTGDILTFMHDRGFALFDLSVAAAWHRRAAGRVGRKGKRQLIGLDLLFFREPCLEPRRFASPVAAAKAAAIAELYDFPDLALEILELCSPTPTQAPLIDKLKQSLISEKTTDTPPRGMLRRLLGRRKSHRPEVKLHY